MSLLDTLFKQQAFVISLAVVAILIVGAFAVLVGASIVQWRRQHPAKKRSKTKLARQRDEESATSEAAEQIVATAKSVAAASTAATSAGQPAQPGAPVAAPAGLVPPAIVQAALAPAGGTPSKGGAVEKISGINDILASVFVDDKAEHRKTLLHGVEDIATSDLIALAVKIRDGLITQKTANPE